MLQMRSLRSFLRSFLLAAALAATVPALAQYKAPAVSSVPAKAPVCTACHGPAGNADSPLYPILAGQTARYLYLQLKDFKEGRRSDPQMSPIAADLSSGEMLELANYFAAQKPSPQTFKADPQKVEAGRKKADEVLCSMCHLGGFAGQNEIPRVAGQNYDYVVKELKDFKAKRRTNDAGNMTSVAGTLSDQDIDNLANFVSNLN